ncbi:MAG: hypothetical protein COV98_01600 [Candidatus Altarchaeum sp. CG12_big_fil_rev_8_21_14_0_65_33_22]|nr:MAG: hypothetical protein AUK59_05890 [Candidatus Altarchaeum sp. CG2_30_32_3053]PIN67759.1 MAG: hypothetical protein COV98_01600 [Candidatus Altarchaeum sp. CG12_big_fil_rev_8_21_14_0_65_33_22]PIX48950.1 MAG: hypothetical protein COZ53_02355 [Candidatus Altarchaeum sp. CG_4_8_14_3_um_filter_33_2054]PIZ32399.1 MAG: hypothetical protein COY41_01270 [Candidatus Altarchaeum sp. CG_4_10_14_0_8_um_filter_32_851]
MKFGLKLWSKNKDLIGEACKLINENFFHYVELFYVPGTEIKPFLDHNIPYIIHNSTERFGVNIGDKTKKEFNLKIINTCINWANKLNAKYIIQHADYGSFEDAKNLLKEVHDERIVIENMPNAGINGEKMIGYEPEQLKELMDIGDFGFCLDFGHAAKAAVSMGKNYRGHINEFLKLKPDMFHISDCDLKNGIDEHLNIGEGDIDFKFLKECILSENSENVTLETPRKNLNSLDEDLKNLEKLKELFVMRNKFIQSRFFLSAFIIKIPAFIQTLV